MTLSIPQIVGILCRKSVELGSQATKLRLVKFLYLLDLYNAQETRKTFTGWQWRFVHYGPFCPDSTRAIDNAASAGYIAATTYESRFRDEDFHLFRPDEGLADLDFAHIQDAFSFYVSGRLLEDLRKYHDDTYGLLDYVYFRTGPMRDARPGDTLDFSKEEKVDPSRLKPVALTPLSKSKLEKARAAIGRIAADVESPSFATGPRDKAYYDFLAALEDDPLPEGIAGEAKLTFDE